MKAAISEFLSRSTEKPLADTTLAKVLADLPSLGVEGPWLGGGALRRTLLGQEPASDFDFFFRDQEQLAAFTSALEARGFGKVKETEHHIQYRGRAGAEMRDVQCIRFAYYANAAEVIASFDYTICMLAFDGEHITVGDYTLWDLGRRRLAINKITYPVSTMRRMLKYTSQGFTACAGCLATILRTTAESPDLLNNLGITYVD